MALNDIFAKYANDDTLEVEGIVDFAEKELGIASDDIAVYVLAWKLKAEKPASISAEEWRKGMSDLGCKSVADVKKRLDSLRSEIVVKTHFTDFYKWIFRWSREQPTARFIKKDAAIDLWQMLIPRIPNTNWIHMNDWLQFMAEKFAAKTITEDLWTQLLVWITTPNSADLSKYDDAAAWPAAIDQFVQWMNAGKK